MAHKLLGERFASRTAPAWHGLGTTFLEPLSATEATRRAGADFGYTRKPAFAQSDDGTLIQIPGTYAVIRDGLTPRPGEKLTERQRSPCVLGTCSADYEIIGNLELAALLDPLAEVYPVETVGVLDDGERIFYCLRAREHSYVANDEIRNYFTVLDTKTPGHRAKVFYSPVRTVCQNTLTRGLSSASITFDIRHTHGATLEMQFYTSLITEMAREQEETLRLFRAMTQRRMTDDETMLFVKRVFQFPKDPERVRELDRHDYPALIAQGIPGAREKYEAALRSKAAAGKAVERVWEYRKTAMELIARFNDEHTQHARTTWAAYNGCTELSDWRNGRGAAQSVLFGNRAQEKARARQIALEYIGVN